MTSAYNLMKEAAQAEGPALRDFREAEFKCEDSGLQLARKEDPSFAGIRYIARTTPPTGAAQVEAVKALYVADNKYQRAHAEKLHWERAYRGWVEFLEEHPDMADTRLSFQGEWRALLNVKEAR
jgi:hypothetical protein